MAIKVKVLNSTNATEPKVKEEDKPQILTSEYVRELNIGIAYRIRQSQIAQARSVVKAQIDKSIFR